MDYLKLRHEFLIWGLTASIALRISSQPVLILVSNIILIVVVAVSVVFFILEKTHASRHADAVNIHVNAMDIRNNVPFLSSGIYCSTATYQLGPFPQSYLGYFRHNLPGAHILHVCGAIQHTVNGTAFPLPYATPVPGEDVALYADSQNVYVNVGTIDRSSYTGWVIVYYK